MFVWKVWKKKLYPRDPNSVFSYFSFQLCFGTRVATFVWPPCLGDLLGGLVCGLGLESLFGNLSEHIVWEFVCELFAWQIFLQLCANENRLYSFFLQKLKHIMVELV